MTDERIPPAGTDVCGGDDVLDGRARVVALRGRPGVELIVVREGAVICGYINECRHMAVPLNLLDDVGVVTAKHHMLCDHHHATFRFSDGYCVAGPCEGDSLTAVALTTRDGRIVIA
jgi:nitrite reductase/ring-hydroxylating ferredoxin subunit